MNEEKFSGKDEYYDKFRPSYPSELIDLPYSLTRAEAVADIGAGTGKFTEKLLEKPRENDECYADFVKEIDPLYDKYQQNGLVSVSYTTSCYAGTF